MRTAFVARPLEFGFDVTPDTAPEDWFDIYAKDFVGLAQVLGVSLDRRGPAQRPHHSLNSSTN